MQAEIKYNGETIETLNDGEYATIHTKDMKMEDDIRVELAGDPTTEDNPLPIEVSTADEMSALLDTAPIGAIYKYIGETTDTYENGVKYELCE